jgi:hypothetical protein
MTGRDADGLRICVVNCGSYSHSNQECVRKYDFTENQGNTLSTALGASKEGDIIMIQAATTNGD